MAGRSARGRWERVLQAREQSRSALGRTNQPGLFDGPPKTRPTAFVPHSRPPAEPRRDESVGVLMLGEAAARLGLRRADLEVMIATGKITSLPTGETRTIPSREVERLMTQIRQVVSR